MVMFYLNNNQQYLKEVLSVKWIHFFWIDIFHTLFEWSILQMVPHTVIKYLLWLAKQSLYLYWSTVEKLPNCKNPLFRLATDFCLLNVFQVAIFFYGYSTIILHVKLVYCHSWVNLLGTAIYAACNGNFLYFPLILLEDTFLIAKVN